MESIHIDYYLCNCNRKATLLKETLVIADCDCDIKYHHNLHTGEEERWSFHTHCLLCGGIVIGKFWVGVVCRFSNNTLYTRE
jgi:hypothetical protein